MNASSGKWGDLPARVGSAAVMALVGILAVWLGGAWFFALVALVGGGMVWELTRMMAPDRPALHIPMGALAGFAIYIATLLPGQAVLPVLIAPAIVGATQLSKDRMIYAAYVAALMLACFGLIVLRDVRGI